MTQADKARLFASLHRPGDPLVLYNVWDAGSAKAVAEAGAEAIATGSASVAAAHGFSDAEALPLDLALANAERVVQAVDLPVTIDFEGAYGAEPEAVGRNMARLAATGAVGCNFEDQVIGGEGLHPVAAQAERIRAGRAAAGPDFFINARTDIFLKARAETHDGRMVDEALERARAYAEAGASGFFVPGLVDLALLQRLCAASPLPVNFMAFPGAPPAAAAAAAGVARISHGPFPYRLAIKALKTAAEEIYG
ncbi:MAG: isocitrate lyase/phosphoenolpyruvate mutase family protein [Alphaproteobacteria bacterium]|nr:isocitrate lyase/phosphoenolpyruvate mutase family protein [Alphaproteobacteria bacterium]MBV9373390.1 isocitrate lyase/phosphoenolpyruvate mutase family protein [Alphaproteobacteria bacterium]MBV9900389.1 isocitrate lyase/phosphoenolpyruvate mutase family protein [Alphaproteobacteria bacterium]